MFTIYGDENLTIYRPANRQINVKYKPALTSLYADEICSVFNAEKNIEPPHKVLIDTGAILMTGINATETQKLNEQQSWHKIDMGVGIRAVIVTDANNQKYLLIVNFTEQEKSIDLTPWSLSHQFSSLTSPEKNIQENELLPK